MNEPAQPPQKKGMSPLAWIAIGCVGLILISAVVLGVGGFFAVKKGKELVEELGDNPARSLAEMAIKMNPEVEFIESDDESVTFRNSDGEVMTMNFEDIEDGLFTMQTEDGETSTVSFGRDGFEATGGSDDGGTTNFNVFGGGTTDASDLPTEIRFPGGENFGSTFTSKNETESSGMINYETDASKEDIIAWHKENLGESCSVSEVNIAGSEHASLDCGPNSATLTFMSGDGRLKVITNYSIKH